MVQGLLSHNHSTSRAKRPKGSGGVQGLHREPVRRRAADKKPRHVARWRSLGR